MWLILCTIVHLRLIGYRRRRVRRIFFCCAMLMVVRSSPCVGLSNAFKLLMLLQKEGNVPFPPCDFSTLLRRRKRTKKKQTSRPMKKQTQQNVGDFGLGAFNRLMQHLMGDVLLTARIPTPKWSSVTSDHQSSTAKKQKIRTFLFFSKKF